MNTKYVPTYGFYKSEGMRIPKRHSKSQVKKHIQRNVRFYDITPAYIENPTLWALISRFMRPVAGNVIKYKVNGYKTIWSTLPLFEDMYVHRYIGCNGKEVLMRATPIITKPKTTEFEGKGIKLVLDIENRLEYRLDIRELDYWHPNFSSWVKDQLKYLS